MPSKFQLKGKVAGVVEIRTIGDSWDKMYYWDSKSIGLPTVSRTEYNNINKGFILHIIDKVIAGHKVFLSSGNSLGSLQIVGKKYKPKLKGDKVANLAPSWKRTKELRSRMGEQQTGEGQQLPMSFCFNEHTGGVRYKVTWSQKDMIMTNKSMYYFATGRKGFRYKVNKSIMAGTEYYVKLGNDSNKIQEQIKANRYAKQQRYKQRQENIYNNQNFNVGREEEGNPQRSQDSF